ncbi:hypothetical protein DRO29_00105 [Candidatus Bathyarchaeota archaeon]|nr:MAG: hypothetical protein DRO29_00105 [Candidatus Bathyarchaeota archaeon]
MPRCPRCGTPLPKDENLRFCPNCGTRIKFRPVGMNLVMKDLSAGVFGALISVMIFILSPPEVNLYFLPSFASAIFVIYIYKVQEIKDALIVAFTVYLFANGILGGLVLGTFAMAGEPYNTHWIPQIHDVILYSFEPVSAFIAGYVGLRISPARVEERAPIAATEREERLGGVVYAS